MQLQLGGRRRLWLPSLQRLHAGIGRALLLLRCRCSFRRACGHVGGQAVLEVGHSHHSLQVREPLAWKKQETAHEGEQKDNYLQLKGVLTQGQAKAAQQWVAASTAWVSGEGFTQHDY